MVYDDDRLIAEVLKRYSRRRLCWPGEYRNSCLCLSVGYRGVQLLKQGPHANRPVLHLEHHCDGPASSVLGVQAHEFIANQPAVRSGRSPDSLR